MPYRRNPHFTGRRGIFERLASAAREIVDKKTLIVDLIAGLGGVGKTQVVVNYAYEYSHVYSAIYFMRTETSESLITSILELIQFERGQAQANNINTLTLATVEFRCLVSEKANCLIIFDNAQGSNLIQSLLPDDAIGHVVITSRTDSFQEMGLSNPIRLLPFNEAEASEFLLARTGRQAEPGSSESLAVSEIVNQLGRLPLALEQCGAYVYETQASFKDYLASYQNLRLKLLDRRRPLLGDYPESVSTTWSVNFKQVRSEAPLSSELLRLASLYDSSRIPFELICGGLQHQTRKLASKLGNVRLNPMAIYELLEPLRRYSLIEVNYENKSVNIHQLVQEVVVSRLTNPASLTLIRRALLVANSVIEKIELEDRKASDRILTHAIAIANKAATRKSLYDLDALPSLYSWIGNVLAVRGEYIEAEHAQKQACAVWANLRGLLHPQTVDCMTDLGWSQYTIGKHFDAMRTYVLCIQAIEHKAGVARGLLALPWMDLRGYTGHWEISSFRSKCTSESSLFCCFTSKAKVTNLLQQLTIWPSCIKRKMLTAML